jgi:tetratricopeptide (TPR) repeat protein
VPENPRIELLRQRIKNDPASIAFAQLAEEYRRAGSYAEAIETCRAGLGIHPGYLSARVTLGRALIEVNDLDSAESELTYVLGHAAENLAAIRGLAEIHHRRGELNEALGFYQAALGLARHDPDLEQTISDISRSIAPAPAVVEDGMSFEQATAEFLSFLDQYPAPAESPAPVVEEAGLKASPTLVSPVEAPDVGPGFSPALDDQPKLTVADDLVAMPAADLKASPTPVAVAEAGLKASPTPVSPVEAHVGPGFSPAPDPALPGLKRFLKAIHMYRQRRTV